MPFPTGTVEVTLNEGGIPCYEIKQSVAWDNVPYTPELDQLACQTRCVCFGTLAQRNVVTRTTLNRFLDAMPGEAYKVFDINLRQHFYTVEILKDSLSRCNLLKLNDEELVILSDLLELSEESVEKRCREIMDRFDLKMLILTYGVQGSYVFSDDIRSFLNTPHVKVVDTVGAGDSFTAAFCAAVLKGKSMVEAHRLAVEVSAFVCSQAGAMPRLPEELKGML